MKNVSNMRVILCIDSLLSLLAAEPTQASDAKESGSFTEVKKFAQRSPLQNGIK
jgi:hypothetical protein